MLIQNSTDVVIAWRSPSYCLAGAFERGEYLSHRLVSRNLLLYYRARSSVFTPTTLSSPSLNLKDPGLISSCTSHSLIIG